MTKRRIHTLFQMVRQHFKGNTNATFEWWKTKNPNLGHKSPGDLVHSHQVDRLEAYIKSHIERGMAL